MDVHPFFLPKSDFGEDTAEIYLEGEAKRIFKTSFSRDLKWIMNSRIWNLHGIESGRSGYIISDVYLK